MPRSFPASHLAGALFMAVLSAVHVVAAQQVVTFPPLAYSPGEATYRLRLHSVTVTSSPDTTATSTQRHSADVLLTLLFRSLRGAPTDVIGIRVDTVFATTSGLPVLQLPPAAVELPATPRGLQADMEVPLSDSPLLQAAVSAVIRCLPALPATRSSTWRSALTVRWRRGRETVWSEQRDRSWRAQGRVDVTSQGRRVRALRVAGSDSVRVTSDGPTGSGTGAIDALLDSTGVLLSMECAERDTVLFQFGDRRIVQAVEHRAEFASAPSRASPPRPAQTQAAAVPPADPRVREMASMLTDLVGAQQRHFASDGRYYQSYEGSVFRGTYAAVDTVTADGWSAIVARSDMTVICRIFVGSAPHAAGAVAGTPLCREPVPGDPTSPAPWPPDSMATEDQLLAAMQHDLRRLVRAQWARFVQDGQYAGGLLSLRFTPSHGVVVTVDRARVAGWQATARHPGTSQVCRIYVGSATIEGLSEGQPACRTGT